MADDAAFADLVAPYRGELHAHCYRMLGSSHDAEDALQETLLRAWRALARFEGRSSLRSWLYTIATNTCLTQLQRRSKRTLPVDFGPPADPADGPGAPLEESVWLEPYPDAGLGYEQREGVELAFIAALQHLPATQRAVLILREVLGFSAAETAEALDTTVASVNSALQRARKAVDERAPERSQQATLRALGDDGIRQIVERYIDAMGRADVDAVVAMLAEDAAWSMPPLASWFGGRDAVREFLRRGPLSGEWRWRHLPASANGQPAVAVYHWDEASGTHLPFALDVMTLDGDRIRQITAFITRTIDLDDFSRWPEAPLDGALAFEDFGLPAQVA
jgi:RNA polymerase sigma-70 factor (ECF subfamily)